MTWLSTVAEVLYCNVSNVFHRKILAVLTFT